MSFESDLKAFKDKVDKALQELVSPKVLKEIGQFEAELVKRRSRLGYGVPQDLGPKEKFQPLAKITIERRRKSILASGITSPGKSNLTKSGQLLDDIVSKVENRSTVIGHTKNRNKRIGAFHQTGGGKLPQRRYLGLAKEDIRQIRAKMEDIFNDIINRLLK